MTYALGSASFVGRTAAAAISKPLPVSRVKIRHVRSTSLKLPSYTPRDVVEIRAEVAEEKAFEEMFVASRTKFVAMAQAILRNREDAEDAVQNAFLSGYLHLRSFQGRSALSTWFTRVVLNAALMIQRKRGQSKVKPLPEANHSREVNWTESIPASQPDPEMIHAERETVQFIDGILRKMKPVLRQAFTLAHFDELSATEASALLGVSAATFKARLFRARRHILVQTDRALVAPIHKTTLFSPEFLKCK